MCAAMTVPYIYIVGIYFSVGNSKQVHHTVMMTNIIIMTNTCVFPSLTPLHPPPPPPPKQVTPNTAVSI